MKKAFILALFLASSLQGLDYELQFENNRVAVGKAVIAPHEEIGFHRDPYPQVIFPIKGGVVTRFESDGGSTEVDFTTGKAVYRNADRENELHRTISRSDTPLELLIVQLKNSSQVTSLLAEAANRYLAFVGRLSQGEKFEPFADVKSILSSDCKKIFNGALLTSTREEFVEDLLQVYKTHGSWNITPADIIPSAESQTVTIRLFVDIKSIGKFTEMLLLRMDANGLIHEINIVFNKVQDGYHFDE